MIDIFIDIETLPDSEGVDLYVKQAMKNVKVPSSMVKQNFIDDLKLGASGKEKTVAELKTMWLEKFGKQQAESKGDEEWRKTSFDGARGSICSIATATLLDDRVFTFDAREKSEAQVLEKLMKWVSDCVGNKQWRFVAFYAKFDLPFLFQRCVINKVKPVYFNPHGRHGSSHYCAMEAWAGFGNRISLSNLADALGIEGKGEIDGSQVCDLWRSNPDAVVSYNADDVRILKEVYKRLEFIYE